MSCFDGQSAKELIALKGSSASVETIESGEFKNIKKCLGKTENKENQSTEDKDEVEVQKIERAPQDKSTTMYVSYVKDIFCSLLSVKSLELNPAPEIMKEAINLVKQAKEAFN
jgi:hypothetical protein